MWAYTLYSVVFLLYSLRTFMFCAFHSVYTVPCNVIPLFLRIIHRGFVTGFTCSLYFMLLSRSSCVCCTCLWCFLYVDNCQPVKQALCFSACWNTLYSIQRHIRSCTVCTKRNDLIYKDDCIRPVVKDYGVGMLSEERRDGIYGSLRVLRTFTAGGRFTLLE